MLHAELSLSKSMHEPSSFSEIETEERFLVRTVYFSRNILVSIPRKAEMLSASCSDIMTYPCHLQQAPHCKHLKSFFIAEIFFWDSVNAMTATCRVFFKIILMIVLGRVKFTGFGYFSDDLILEFS